MLSAIDKRDVWSRWKVGQTLHEIGGVYGKCHNTVRAVLLPRGGIPPLARRRSRLPLTFAERGTVNPRALRKHVTSVVLLPKFELPRRAMKVRLVLRIEPFAELAHGLETGGLRRKSVP